MSIYQCAHWDVCPIYVITYSVPCDLNEVFRITVISHCIATARVPKQLKTLANKFIHECSQLFSSKTDVRPILNKIKELIPDFSFSIL